MLLTGNFFVDIYLLAMNLSINFAKSVQHYYPSDKVIPSRISLSQKSKVTLRGIFVRSLLIN